MRGIRSKVYRMSLFNLFTSDLRSYLSSPEVMVFEKSFLGTMHNIVRPQQRSKGFLKCRRRGYKYDLCSTRNLTL